MLRVGLTGGIASGKSSVAREFAQLGAHIIDADLVAREVVEPGTAAARQIIEHFGENLVDADGLLDRAKLRHIIFTHPAEKIWLENLIHPLVRMEIERQLAQPFSCQNGAEENYRILVSPLLFETQQNNLVDRTLVVDVPEELQKQRAMARDMNSATLITAIMANQFTREQRLSRADDVIDNSGDFSHTQLAIQKLHVFYQQLAQSYDC